MLMQTDSNSQNNANASIASPEKTGSESNKQDSTTALDLRQAAHDYQDRNGQHHPIAEFLYQLTKMLTDDNSEIIEWSDGRIRVHHPERLEAEVLHKYFRHSKFASFQRQLNYFGFRKIAGKGKMSPCSYVNDAASTDIRSILLIKRKTNGSAARKAAMQHRGPAGIPGNGMNPALGGMNLQSMTGGGQQLSMFNGQSISNAMALLQENALRAGLGQHPLQQGNAQAQLNLLALQHQQQLQQEMQNQQLRAAVNQQQQQGQGQDQQRGGAQAPAHQGHQQMLARGAPAQNDSEKGPAPASGPNIDQLRAQIAAITGQNAFNANSLNASAYLAQFSNQKQDGSSNFNQASNALNSATAALNSKPAGSNPASAALNAQNNSTMPATAAMDAATGQATANLFESAANLKSLLNEHGSGMESHYHPTQRNQNYNNMNSMASQVLLNRLPSSNTIFPENSTLSFGGMLGSSNRLSSLLSLSSFVGSREPSMADLAGVNANMGNMGAPYGAPSNAGVSHMQMAEAASKFRSSNN
jgi:hypothetical protein